MSNPAALPEGTQPEGAKNQQEASRQVREMFTRIAPRYDLLNHLLSAQMDRLWRSRTARELKPILSRPEAVVLDLCCGTGDLAFALQRNSKARILGADFSHTMLVRALEKAAAANGTSPMPFLEADALRLPFASGSFDLVTSAFGFRNLANYRGGPKGNFPHSQTWRRPSAFWSSLNQRQASSATLIAFTPGRSCQRSAAGFPEIPRPTPTSRNLSPVFSVQRNSLPSSAKSATEMSAITS